jgi:nitric oxide reductase NorD protein
VRKAQFVARFWDLFEPEEAIGRRWHQLVGASASWPRHTAAGVDLGAMKGPLAVFFRGLGGAAGLAIAATTPRSSRHRLSRRLHLFLGEERIDQARRDRNALYLPARLEVFPDPALNRTLYFWLAAFFAHLPVQTRANESDPLRRDLVFLRDAHDATAAALAENPGLISSHVNLCENLRLLRPARRLPPVEAMVERAVLALLGDPLGGGDFWSVIIGGVGFDQIKAPVHYRPFLPVPLWGEAIDDHEAGAAPGEDSPTPESSAAQDPGDERVHTAKRRPSDQMNRKDSLILNRFEKILTFIDSLNINRAIDDDDPDSARKALADAEEIGLSSQAKRPSTRLRFHLDLASPAVEGGAIDAEFVYPEWDYRKRCYNANHCRVVTGLAPATGEGWRPDAAALRRIKRVRKQFEALRQRAAIQRGEIDGAELDLEALVRSRTDFRANGCGSDRIYCARRRLERDLSVAFLVDVSLSTDSWIANRRVLDIEKEAVLTLAHGLAACGDDYGIFTFTSRRRDWVKIDAVKDFDEPFGVLVSKRIASLKPEFYTRTGAAIRHANERLKGRPSGHRLLLVLTDGKPNDVDHYEGRYGVEDTRRAIQQARRDGCVVFGITIDVKAQDYFPALFGRGGYAIVGDATRLPAALPAIYRRLISS